MKKKMPVKVCINCMNDDKSRSKALKIAVGLLGVESASLKGDDKSQIEVIGDGVDPVKLICQLQKNVGCAELVSVSAGGGGGKKEEKKEVKKEEKKEEPCGYADQYQPCSIWTYHRVPPCVCVYQYDPCSIV